MWLAAAAALVLGVMAAVHVHGACQTTRDCFMNGNCINGGCHCDPGWRGDNCSLLNVAPAPPGGAYGFNPNVTSWGGMPIEVNGKYHLYVAEIVGNCGLNKWGSNSRCVHAVADSIGGPYTFADEAVGVWCHGPQIAVDNSAGKPKYLLFHIVNRPDSPYNNCSTPLSDAKGSFKPHAGARARGSSLHVSDSPNGPWQAAGTVPDATNPSPVIFPNGSITFIGQDWHVQTAPHWSGPWSSPGSVQWHGDGGAGCKQSGDDWHCQGWEDPFLFYDNKRSVWKMVAHVWPAWAPDEPRCDHDYSLREAGYAYSFDTVNWHRSSTPPFDNKVKRTDGTTSLLSTRERPKIVFDSKGVPIALFNGVSGNPPPWGCKIKPGVDATYTLYVPIEP